MIFKGIDLNNYDALILQRGERQKAKKVYYDYGKLPASSVTLFEDTGTYEPYERELHILSKNQDELGDLYQWLDGAGDLDLDEGVYYKARVIGDIDTVTESISLGWKRLIITFEIQPYAYKYPLAVTLTNGQTVYNQGLPVKPMIKITGSGNVVISVNGKNYRINNISSYVTLDYPFAYKDLTNKGRDVLDGYPELVTGTNVISWTGTVTKVEAVLVWKTL